MIRDALLGLASLAIALWLALFVPSWSLDYWQAWIYWLLFLVSALAITFYFVKRDPKLIKSRIKAGPTAEKEAGQKIIQMLASIFFIVMLVVPSLDHHFHWSSVPVYLVVIADVFVVLGFLIVFLVFKENSHASGIIEVSEGQQVITTGPYGIVRHPMYAGAFLMLLFTPIALGSFLGVLAVIPLFGIIVLRLIDEEKFLAKNLPGYIGYCQMTRYRLVPFIW